MNCITLHSCLNEKWEFHYFALKINLTLFDQHFPKNWILFPPLWILKYIGDVWGSVAHVGFFLWFPVVFDGFKAVFSGFKSVVNNLLMIKHLKIYAFCFLCTLKFLGTGWARSPAFWVCLTSTLLRQLASLSSSFLMHANTRLIPFIHFRMHIAQCNSNTTGNKL